MFACLGHNWMRVSGEREREREREREKERGEWVERERERGEWGEWVESGIEIASDREWEKGRVDVDVVSYLSNTPAVCTVHSLSIIFSLRLVLGTDIRDSVWTAQLFLAILGLYISGGNRFPGFQWLPLVSNIKFH